MTNFKKLIGRFDNKESRNAFWIIVEKIIQMLLSLLISIVTARYLGPSNYGIINYATAYIAFFTSLCTLGINSILVREIINRPEEEGLTIGTTLVLRIASSFLSSLLIMLIVVLLNKGEYLTIVVTLLCCFSLLFQVFNTLNYWFQARYQSKVTARVTLIAYVVSSIYKIILLILQKDVRWFAFATSVDYICTAVLLLQAYRRSGGMKFSFSWKKGRYLLSQSYHYILAGMMVAIYGQTDKMMLKQMLDVTSVGYYSLASSINSMWVFILAAIIDSMQPTIMRYFKDGHIEQFKRKNRQLYAIVIYLSVFVALCIALFGRFVVVTVYGEAYAPAVNPLKIVAWYTMFSYLGVARNSWIVCEGKQKYLKYMYCSAAVINVFLNLLMIPLWGASGAAMASLITQVCTIILLPTFFRELRPNTKLIFEAFFLKGIK